MSIAKVSLCDFFLSIQIIWEFTRYGLQEKTELLILSFYSMLVGNGKVLRLYSDTHAALPLLARAVNSHSPVLLHSEGRKTGNSSFTAARIGGKPDFPAFLRSEGRKAGNCRFTAVRIGGKVGFRDFLLSEGRRTGNCSFTAALIGGNLDFPVFLRSEGRKTGNCTFTVVLIGGKVDFPAFLRPEGTKTGDCRSAAGTYGGDLTFRFLIIFSLLSPVGGSLVGA